MGSFTSKYSITKITAPSAAPANTDWLANKTSKINISKQEQVTNIAAVGKGKFGHVFLSKCNNNSRHIALKYISKQFIHECQCIVKLQNELDILNKLDHPFLITYYCVFESISFFSIGMEYAVGGEMFTLMKKMGKMTESQAKFYFIEISLALSHLHDKLNIVYRDLKPENILLDHCGHVKLCDFGFAVYLNKSSTYSDNTSSGSDSKENGAEGNLVDGCGTAMYVAPEIAGGFARRPHGYPVDWWGLGCVLYEMITSKAPFGDTEHVSKFEIFNNINAKNVSLPLFASKALKTVIRNLLEKDPSRRWNWYHISTCEWLKSNAYTFDDFLSCRISPPWVPAKVNEPNSSNFLIWRDVKIPSDTPSSDAAIYCSSIVFPKSRGASKASSLDDDAPGGVDTNSPTITTRKKPMLNRQVSGLHRGTSVSLMAKDKVSPLK